MSLARRLERTWYKQTDWLGLCLVPISWLYCGVSTVRRIAYRWRLLSSGRPLCPVIIIGNLTVGGTGKTPVVIACANWLQQQGYKPGIISRGYKGQTRDYPLLVSAASDPLEAGDEPVLIADKTQCPVVVDPDRLRGCTYLTNHADVDIIVSDDGLQHYGLQRDIEIVVFDGQRGVGNGHCLPAGPLREPVSRLKDCQLLLYNLDKQDSVTQRFSHTGAVSFDYTTVTSHAQQINDPVVSVPLETLATKSCQLLSGIGNPQRFYTAMGQYGITGQIHTYSDHHIFIPKDIDFDADVILMTDKDAIKCRSFADDRHWSVPIHAELPAGFYSEVKTLLSSLGTIT